MAISRKTLIPRQEGGIVLLSVLSAEKKNLEFNVRKKDARKETEKET